MMNFVGGGVKAGAGAKHNDPIYKLWTSFFLESITLSLETRVVGLLWCVSELV